MFAQDMGSVFVSMPKDLLLGVSLEQRKSLATSESDSLTNQAIVINAVGDSIVRTAYSDDYMSIKTSDVGTLEFKLLPLVNDSYIVAVVTTVCGSICDSRIDFYSTAWEVLDKNKLFPIIDINTFLIQDLDKSSLEIKNALAPVDMLPVKYHFRNGTANLEIENELGKYLSKNDYEVVKSYLKTDPIVLVWDKLMYR